MKKISGSIIFSGLAGVVAAAALIGIYKIPRPIIFLIVAGLWWGLIILAHWFFSFEKKHLFLHLATSVTLVSLLSLIEWRPLAWFIIALSVPLFAFVWHWSAEMSRQHTALSYKTWRRIIMMLWVLNVFGWSSGLFSLSIFFQHIPHVLLALVGAVFASTVAAANWHVYFDAKIETFAFWIVILTLVMYEVMWVLYYLPLGYFTLGLLYTWMWYVLTLFIRFHLTRGGILWQKQRIFLISNALLFISVLYIARWI